MKKFAKILIIVLVLMLTLTIFVGCDYLSGIFGEQGSDYGDTEIDDNGNSDTGGESDIDSSENIGGETDIGGGDVIDPPIDEFEDYGMRVLTVHLTNVYITQNGKYTSVEEVAAYLYTYHALPSNFVKKNQFDRGDYTSSNKLSCGGDTFHNYEGLLPEKSGRTYKECDINYTGGSRGKYRICFSSDWLIFYTDTHYESFYIVRVIE